MAKIAEKRNTNQKGKHKAMEQPEKARIWHRSWNKLKHPSQFSKAQLALFVLAFGLIGYLLVKTFAAAPVVATLEAEQMTPAGVNTSNGFMTNLTNNGTITTPYLWTFDPGTTTTAGYFYADGKLIKKITGPGPYVLRLNTGMLSGGAHKLGGSWDTTSGVHKTFPSAYSEKVNNISGSGFITTLTGGMNVNAPYIWAFDPGTASKAGYFWADGHLLNTVNGAGPYALMMNSSTLTSGSHTLGHAWDTTAGVHQTPPSSYKVTFNPGSSSSNYSVITDSAASGGKAVSFGGGVSLSGSVSLSTAGTSVTVTARGQQCNSAWPQMNVAVDGTTVINTTVSATSWNGYSANLNLTSGTHTLKITNSSSSSCTSNLSADVTTFYGQTIVTPAPTVALSASPTSVTSGQSSTLTWTSTNATSCTASGAWSGSEPTSGSVSTGALNQNSTYSLTCTGAGGSASASTTVSVSAPTGTSFLSLTSWARPAPGTPSAAQASGWHMVPFTDLAGLKSALGSLQGHDYIYYAGTGRLLLASSSNLYGGGATLLNFNGKNPSSPAVIDFGVSKSIWNPSAANGNYVEFDYTGGINGWAPMVFSNASNLRVYGGDFTGNGGGGVNFYAPTHDITWWDGYIHNVPGSGIGILSTTVGGAASVVYNLNLRAEVNRWAMNPAVDNHIDKGAGLQAVIIHGNNNGGTTRDISVALYAHDPLKPGETSYGKVWPQGGGGSAIEPGNDVGQQYNMTFYLKAENLLMIPAVNGGPLNPGSKPNGETDGDGFKIWGKAPLSNVVVPWMELTNATGAVMMGSGGYSHLWASGNPPITVEHGRHSNTNQFVGQGSTNIAQPYDTRYTIVYHDIQ